jgi:hypothetical protein
MIMGYTQSGKHHQFITVSNLFPMEYYHVRVIYHVTASSALSSPVVASSSTDLHLHLYVTRRSILVDGQSSMIKTGFGVGWWDLASIKVGLWNY